MNITLAQYQNDALTGAANSQIVATIDSVTVTVPLDPANRHYAEIVRQVDAGELTIEEAD